MPPVGDGSEDRSRVDGISIALIREIASASLLNEALTLRNLALDPSFAGDPAYADLQADQARTLLASGDTAQAQALAAAVVASSASTATLLRTLATAAIAAMAERGAAPSPALAEVLDGLDAAIPTAAGDVRPDTPPESAPASVPTELTGPVDDLAVALGDAALAALLGGDASLAARMAEIARAVSPTDRVSVITGLALAPAALYAGDVEGAVGHRDAFVSVMRESQDEFDLVGYGPWLVDSLVSVAIGDHRDALASITEGHRMAKLVSMPFLHANLGVGEALASLELGRWDDALEAIDRALVHADTTSNHIFHAWYEAMAALVLARRGEIDAARSRVAAAERWQTAMHSGAQHLTWARATLAAATGDQRAAALELLDLCEELAGTDTTVAYLPILLDALRLSSAARVEGDRTMILERLPAKVGDHAASQAFVDAAHALVAQDHPALLAAADALTDSFPYEAAKLLADSATAALAAGSTGLAGRLADRAHRAFGELGAAADAARLQASFAAAGITVQRARFGLRGGFDSLTPAERRVAELVCAGLSNREVGAELSISERTVEAHLTRVFSKVGVSSRLQLAALSFERG